MTTENEVKTNTAITPEAKGLATKAKREATLKKKADAAATLNVMATKRDLENMMFWAYAVSVMAPADMINFGQLQPSTFKKAGKLAKTMRIEWEKADIK